MKKQVLEQFAQPGALYRGKPFWAWNGELEPEELRRQIRIMHEMGLGGFFMHARVGLDTAYLSDRWFECVDACVDEAEKLKMEAWMYDEDRWPSGAAGGIVTKNPAFRRQFLRIALWKHAKDAASSSVVQEVDAFAWSDGVLAAFVAEIEMPDARHIRPLARGTKPALARGEVLVTFTRETEGVSSWYNDQTYLDTMSHDAVKEFLKVTHDAYAKRYGGAKGKFGKVMPGIFTDEPNHGHRFNTLEMPWTESFEKTFRERYGYDIVPKLMEAVFFVDGEAINPVRYHYHDCVTHLFVDAFSHQIGDWCGEHGIQSTGHMLCEDDLYSQTMVVGSCMRHYEYMQAPGMDLLTEHWRIYDVAKQISSVAHQFDRKWRLTETYGCTGWDFPFLGHKALGDWQAALGINLRCQHLSWYTMKGEAKRDYPASIFYQSPWWREYSCVEDYFGRVGVGTTQGAEVRDILVIHPVESTWCVYGMQTYALNDTANETEKLKAARMLLWQQNGAMIDVRDALLSAHLDFDYGDEDIMARHAKVGTDAAGPFVRINSAVYRAVTVPMMYNIRRSTLELLKRFRALGGTVVFAGEAATHVDALPSGDAAAFAAECVRAGSPEKVPATLATFRRVSACDAKGKELPPVLYMLREDEDAFYLFLCNQSLSEEELSRTRKHHMGAKLVRDYDCDWDSATVTLFETTAGAPQEWDATSGTRLQADAKKLKNGWAIRTSFPRQGSRLFVFPKTAQTEKLPKTKQLETIRTKTLAKKSYGLVLSEANALVLNWAQYRIGDGPWSKKPKDILAIDMDARDALGVRHRGGAMCQPWARPKTTTEKTVPLALRYAFDVAALPTGDLSLALEFPERFTVRVNGTLLPADSECGWWTDRSLRKLPCDPSILRIGENVVELTCDYAESHGLEYIYLLGHFGAKVKGLRQQLVPMPTELGIGDWVAQGLPFYGGNVSYCTKLPAMELGKGERVFLELPEWRGVAIRVLAGGEVAGVIGWAPYEVDLTDYCKKGAVDLRIEVLGSRRNCHGPFHLKEKWPAWTGPGSFGVQVEEYQLVPSGLLAQPRLQIRK